MFQVNDLIQIKQGSPLRDIIEHPDKKYRVIMVIEKFKPEPLVKDGSVQEYVINAPDADFNDITHRHTFQAWYVHEQFEVCGRFVPGLYKEVKDGKE